MGFQSKKLLDGFTCCFRQWRATTTHCAQLHGYAVSFLITFEGDLDNRNWVVDFGGFKRSQWPIDGMNPKDWFSWMFDHTTVIAQDDPELRLFQKLEYNGAINLRVVEKVGCEMFAKLVFDKLTSWVEKETNNRVIIKSVECFENTRNSALYTV